eukprot:1494083-Prymnesium_polylepis.1
MGSVNSRWGVPFSISRISVMIHMVDHATAHADAPKCEKRIYLSRSAVSLRAQVPHGISGVEHGHRWRCHTGRLHGIETRPTRHPLIYDEKA